MTVVDRSRPPAVGPDPAFFFPHIVRHTLSNGLSVRTVEHYSVPVMACVLQVEAGAAADMPGREGLAALVADMLDEGTGDLDAIEVSEAFARIGAEYEVDVGSDVTMIAVTALERFAGRALGLVADLAIRPSLRPADFDRVRQLRLNRLKQLKDLPPAVAERTFVRLVYGKHPYGHLAIGDESALRELALGDVTGFHTQRYRPATATLIMVGPCPHAEMLAMAEAAFAGWRSEQEPVSGVPASDVEPPRVPALLAVVPRAGAAQSELRIGHLSTRRKTPDHAALLVMNAVLGGQFVSRLNLRLREEKGYTYGARTGFDWKRGMAPFFLQASVHTAATADAIRDTLAELEAIRGERPPTEAEMLTGRASLTRGYPRNFETAAQVARSMAQLALYDLPDSYFEDFVPRVLAVEADDVVRAAQRYIDPARAVTLVVGDYSVIAESLASLGLGEPQLLPAEPM